MEEKTASTIEKKLRFRQPAKTVFETENITDLKNDYNKKYDVEYLREDKCPSFTAFLKVELTKDYQLENDEEKFSAGREKFYSFLKIPKEVEKFMIYGVMNCVDNFLFVFTFLPLRVILALWALVTRPFSYCFGSSGHINKRILTPAEICDLLKAVILIFSTMVLWMIDTSMMYHVIKSQSVIKLYIFYNMLDVGDRLLISLGQDTIDALLWTATEPKSRKREHLGVIPHLVLAVIYVEIIFLTEFLVVHSSLILFQATTLNVAINANNKGLLTIMMSNNFVELKGSVFKKFDKNNLFQVSCSDVRERFHLIILLFIVTFQTLKAYNWKVEILWQLMFDSTVVMLAEILVDWIKHAFVSRFNELDTDVYKDYRTSLAYDLSQKLQKDTFSGHSDLIARRMGFIPLPLGAVVARVLLTTINIDNVPALCIIFIGYLCLWSLKILNSILILGKACSIITQHRIEKTAQNSPINQADARGKYRSIATSPQHPVNEPPRKVLFKNGFSPLEVKENGAPAGDLGASAIFANSTVDLKDASLNEELLKINGEDIRVEQVDEIVTRSVPDIKKELSGEDLACTKNDVESLKKSESEPNLLNMSDSQAKEL